MGCQPHFSHFEYYMSECSVNSYIICRLPWQGWSRRADGFQAWKIRMPRMQRGWRERPDEDERGSKAATDSSCVACSSRGPPKHPAQKRRETTKGTTASNQEDINLPRTGSDWWWRHLFHCCVEYLCPCSELCAWQCWSKQAFFHLRPKTCVRNKNVEGMYGCFGCRIHITNNLQKRVIGKAQKAVIARIASSYQSDAGLRKQLFW